MLRMPEQVDESTGYLFSPRDFNDLAQKMRLALNNGTAISKNAEIAAISKFDIKKGRKKTGKSVHTFIKLFK